MNINESRLRALIRGILLKEAKDYSAFSNSGLPKGVKDKIRSNSKIVVNYGHNPKENIGIISTEDATVKRHFKALKAEKYGLINNKKAQDFISKIEKAVTAAGSKIIKFRDASFGSTKSIGIHDGVQVEERIIIMMNAGMVPSHKVIDKAAELEPKYAEVTIGNKKITRNKFGNTETMTPSFPKLKAKEKAEEKISGDSAKVEDDSAKQQSKPKPKKKYNRTKVRKIQEIIGANPDGDWGSKTSAKWKTWIVSAEAAKGIKEMGMDDVLTPEFLEANKGKALTIAEKAGFTTGSPLDKVLNLAQTISDGTIDIEQDDQGPQWRKGLEKVYGSDDRLSKILQQFDTYISQGYAPSTASNAVKRSYGTPKISKKPETWRKGLEKVYDGDDRLSEILQQFDNYISQGYAPSTASNAIKRSYGRAIGESPN